VDFWNGRDLVVMMDGNMVFMSVCLVDRADYTCGSGSELSGYLDLGFAMWSYCLFCLSCCIESS